MPTGTTSPYPAGAPTIDGVDLTVNLWLKTPPMVQRTMDALTSQRFITDQVLSKGPDAVGGAVIYDQLTETDLFTQRDVQSIEPGSEFPILDAGEVAPKVAEVSKWGGAGIITYEQARRDRRDVLGRMLTRLRNTVIKKVDTVTIAAIEAARVATLIPSQAASADWSTPSTDIIGDLETARSSVEASDLGYELDTVIIHPTDALGVRKNTGIRAALPRENTANNLIGAKDLDGLLRFDHWYVTPRATAGKVILTAQKVLGSYSDELPLYTRVIDEPKAERYIVQAARVTVPYITDPKSTIVITGA